MSHTIPKAYFLDGDEKHLYDMARLAGNICVPYDIYRSATDFLGEFGYNRPGCVVLEFRIPGMGGLQLQSQLEKAGIDIPLVFVTAHASIETAVQAMKAGAFNVIEKPVSEENLINTIQSALAEGQRRYTRMLEKQTIQRNLDLFTPREREILCLLLDGRTGKGIARSLNLSPYTIENHRANILRKAGVQNSLQLFNWISTGTIKN